MVCYLLGPQAEGVGARGPGPSVRRLPSSFVANLDVAAAVQAEVATWRNLLPPEPWLDAVKNDVAAVQDWVRTRLKAGANNASASITNARKGLQGTRPLPIVGVGERIAYRAMTDFVLATIPPTNRTAADYLAFARAPITHAYGGQSGPRRLGDARLSHIVEADVAAFYQYVDHELLRREVEMQTRNVEGAGYLMELLTEIQGASYGLPQLLDASDALSEVYIRVMERDVIRRGLATWRYNDDFRIGVTSYEAAQDAIEQLSDAARSLGLVLNEHKTYIARFWTYVLRHLPEVDLDATEFDPDDVQIQSDYALNEEEVAEAAVSTLVRLDLPPEDELRIDLKRLEADDLRALRGAINSLRRLTNPGALSRIVHLCLFVPALTPRICDYLVDMHASEVEEVERIWDALTGDHGDRLSEWQAVWLLYVGRRLKLLDTSPARQDFAKRQRIRGVGGLLHAEATLALAEVGAMGFSDLEVATRTEPEPLAPWYVLGVRALKNAGTVPRQQWQAVRDSSPVNRVLIDS